MPSSVSGECLTNTQVAGRELQQKYQASQNPHSLGANAAATGADKGLSTIDGGTTAVQGGDKGPGAKAYGSPASQFLDITV